MWYTEKRTVDSYLMGSLYSPKYLIVGTIDATHDARHGPASAYSKPHEPRV